MSNVVRMPTVEPDSFTIDLPPILPDKQWEMAYTGHSTAVMFGRSQKLVLFFKIVEYGDHFNEQVCKYYNVSLIGKPGKGGRFKPAPSSDFIRDYVRLFGRPTRHDRISLQAMRNRIVIASTRTVTKDRGQ